MPRVAAGPKETCYEVQDKMTLHTPRGDFDVLPRDVIVVLDGNYVVMRPNPAPLPVPEKTSLIRFAL